MSLSLTSALQTGVCFRELKGHEETVSALEWLPDRSGFMSGGMDHKILLWVSPPSHVGVRVRRVVYN